MSKALIAILATILVVAAGGLITAKVFLDKANQASNNEAGLNKESSDVLDDANDQDIDETETLHACDVLTKSQIESALGVSVQDPKTSGVTNIGDKGEVCFYAFEPGGEVTHSFYVDIIQFDSAADADDAQSYSGFSMSGTELSSEYGSFAKYQASESPYNGDMSFVAYLQNGARVTKLIIGQVEGKVTFNEASAKAAIDKMLVDAKLNF